MTYFAALFKVQAKQYSIQQQVNQFTTICLLLVCAFSFNADAQISSTSQVFLSHIADSKNVVAQQTKLQLYNGNAKTQQVTLPSVATALSANANTICVATNSNAINLYNTSGKLLRTYNTTKLHGLACIALCNYNAQYFGCTSCDIFMLDPTQDSIRLLKQEHGIASISSIAKLNSNGLWIGSRSDGLCNFEGDKITCNNNKLQINTIHALNNTLWCATNQGVAQYKDNQLSMLDSSNGLSNNTVLSLCAIDDNTLLATTSQGLNIINTKTLQVAQSNATVTYAMAQGSAHFSKQAMLPTTYDTLQFYELPSAFKDLFKCAISITAFDINGNVISNKKVKLAAKANAISFNIKVPLSTGNNVYARYRLINQTSQWHTLKDDQLHFSNLEPGSYVLQVEVANNSSFNGACTGQYLFSIRSHWYQSWWAVLLGVLLLAAIIRAIMKMLDSNDEKMSTLQQQQTQARYESLKTQINPHFLFNSLNNLVHLIESKDDKASEYAQTMSNFYRSLLTVRTEEVIPLSQEIQFLNKYLYLQKIRYATGFEVDIDIPVLDASDIQIPPLTLQILAENVFKHNTIDAEHFVKIKLYKNETHLIFENTKHEKYSKEPSEGIGLKNINDRYKLICNKAIELEDNKDNFIVKLPLL
ncbi:MAG: hypothetical protein RL660_1902 [Bacteroidota bacterium]